jgi:hypothetical protein
VAADAKRAAIDDDEVPLGTCTSHALRDLHTALEASNSHVKASRLTNSPCRQPYHIGKKMENSKRYGMAEWDRKEERNETKRRIERKGRTIMLVSTTGLSSKVPRTVEIILESDQYMRYDRGEIITQ